MQYRFIGTIKGNEHHYESDWYPMGNGVAFQANYFSISKVVNVEKVELRGDEESEQQSD